MSISASTRGRTRRQSPSQLQLRLPPDGSQAIQFSGGNRSKCYEKNRRKYAILILNEIQQTCLLRYGYACLLGGVYERGGKVNQSENRQNGKRRLGGADPDDHRKTGQLRHAQYHVEGRRPGARHRRGPRMDPERIPKLQPEIAGALRQVPRQEVGATHLQGCRP